MSITVEAKLTAALGEINALVAERDELRVAVEKLTVGASAETETLKVQAAEKDAKIAELLAAVEAASVQAKELTSKVESLEASKVSASKEAAKIVASAGIAPTPLPVGDEPGKVESHLEKFLSLPVGSKARNDYFAAHKSAIINGTK